MNYSEELYIIQNIITIQGEGQNIGKPSLLIRLAGCNLRCDFCDTKWSWNTNSDNSEIRVINENNILQYLRELDELIAPYHLLNVIITGGEPLLYAKNPLFYKLLEYVTMQLNYSFEIETNGLLLDNLNIGELKNPIFGQFINISPKIDKISYNDSEYQMLIGTYTRFIEKLSGKDGGFRESVFKFVDNHQSESRNIIEHIIYDLELNPDWVYVMPQTPNKPKPGESYSEYLEEVTRLTHNTLEFCLKNGHILSPRVHLYLFKDQYEKIII